MSGGINALKVMKEGKEMSQTGRRPGADRMRKGEEKSVQSSADIDVGSDQMGFLLRRDDTASA